MVSNARAEVADCTKWLGMVLKWVPAAEMTGCYRGPSVSVMGAVIGVEWAHSYEEGTLTVDSLADADCTAIGPVVGWMPHSVTCNEEVLEPHIIDATMWSPEVEGYGVPSACGAASGYA